MNKLKRTGLLTIALLLITLLFMLTVPVILNNIVLNEYSKQLYDLALPPDTDIISKYKIVGNLSGTGNHLDFVVTIEVKSLLSKEELIKYYSGFKLKPADDVSIVKLNTKYPFEMEQEHETKVDVIKKEEAKKDFLLSNIYFKGNNASDVSIEPDLFIIKMSDTHYAPGLDFRTH